MTAVTVGFLVGLGIANPMPAFNAPPAPHQSQQCFWRGAKAGDEVRRRVKGLALSAAAGGDRHDPAAAMPVLLDQFRSLFRPDAPGDVTSMTHLTILCSD